MFPNQMIILFVLIPMTAGILCLLVHQRLWIKRIIGFTSLGMLTGLGIWALLTTLAGADDGSSVTVLTSQMGNYPAPFGVSIVVDPLAALMLTSAAIVCLAVMVYSVGQMWALEKGYFHALFHWLVMGVNWSFMTGDLFNLFVAFEIMLMASYAMFCIGTTREQMRHAYKYVLLNLFGSTLLVTGAGLVYGQTGTLNMADLARMSMAGDLPTGMMPVIALLMLVFFGKAATFPIWFWLPETYPTMPAALGGLFAGLLTKVGAYVSLRIFVMVFGPATLVSPENPDIIVTASPLLVPIVLVVAAATMFIGVLGAVSRHTIRGILSIHIISQVGYMVMGVGIGMAIGLTTESRILGVAGAIFFIVHNMVVKCGLFLFGGLMQRRTGSDDLERMGGLLRASPWLGVLFLLTALSLAGLPPLSGFFGKFALVRAGWEAGDQLGWPFYAVTGFAVATSLLTLLSMLKIWSYGFWDPPRGRHTEPAETTESTWRPGWNAGMTGGGILAVLALAMGLLAPVVFHVCHKAAVLVVEPQTYIRAVLGPEAMQTIPLPDSLPDRPTPIGTAVPPGWIDSGLQSGWVASLPAEADLEPRMPDTALTADMEGPR